MDDVHHLFVYRFSIIIFNIGRSRNESEFIWWLFKFLKFMSIDSDQIQWFKEKTKKLSKIMLRSMIENVSKTYHVFKLKKFQNHFNNRKKFIKRSVFRSLKFFFLLSWDFFTLYCCLLIYNIIKLKKACLAVSNN